MRQERQVVPGGLIRIVQGLKGNGVRRPETVSTPEPEDAVRISVCGNDGVMSAFKFARLHGGWNYQGTIVESVGKYRAGSAGEIYGVVPIHGCTALLAGAQRYLLHNLRVSRGAGGTKLTHVIAIQNIDCAFLAFRDQFMRIRTRLVRQNQNAVVEVQIVGREVLPVVRGKPLGQDETGAGLAEFDHTDRTVRAWHIAATQ